MPYDAHTNAITPAQTGEPKTFLITPYSPEPKP